MKKRQARRQAAAASLYGDAIGIMLATWGVMGLMVAGVFALARACGY